MIDLTSITNKIINADCLDILKQLPDKSIDLIVTDPPYGIGVGKKTCIYDLKEKGYTIADQWEDGFNRVGNPTRYKRYFLLEEPN